MFKKLSLLSLTLATLTLIVGCGKVNEVSPELIAYKDDLTNFYNDVSIANAEIKNISYTDKDSIKELLTQLDKVNDAFNEFAEIPIPEEYLSTEELADQAAELMNDAILLYHEALEGEEIDNVKALQAENKYNQAIECINYIGQILQGKTPQGENIITN